MAGKAKPKQKRDPKTGRFLPKARQKPAKKKAKKKAKRASAKPSPGTKRRSISRKPAKKRPASSGSFRTSKRSSSRSRKEPTRKTSPANSAKRPNVSAKRPSRRGKPGGRSKKLSPEASPLKISLGIRTSDALSPSPVLRRDRGIFTFYHLASRLGLAQLHILNIADKVRKATKQPPHELIVRLRSGTGERDKMRDIMTFHREAFAMAGHGARSRTAENADGTIDGELRVDVSKTTKDGFREAILTLGDVANLPERL